MFEHNEICKIDNTLGRLHEFDLLQIYLSHIVAGEIGN